MSHPVAPAPGSYRQRGTGLARHLGEYRLPGDDGCPCPGRHRHAVGSSRLCPDLCQMQLRCDKLVGIWEYVLSRGLVASAVALRLGGLAPNLPPTARRPGSPGHRRRPWFCPGHASGLSARPGARAGRFSDECGGRLCPRAPRRWPFDRQAQGGFWGGRGAPGDGAPAAQASIRGLRFRPFSPPLADRRDPGHESGAATVGLVICAGRATRCRRNREPGFTHLLSGYCRHAHRRQISIVGMSNTCSNAAAESAGSCGGMTQTTRFHGWLAFFQHRPTVGEALSLHLSATTRPPATSTTVARGPSGARRHPVRPNAPHTLRPPCAETSAAIPASTTRLLTRATLCDRIRKISAMSSPCASCSLYSPSSLLIWSRAGRGRPSRVFAPERGGSGFQFSPAYDAPEYFEDIVDLLIPALQERGLFRHRGRDMLRAHRQEAWQLRFLQKNRNPYLSQSSCRDRAKFRRPPAHYRPARIRRLTPRRYQMPIPTLGLYSRSNRSHEFFLHRSAS